MRLIVGGAYDWVSHLDSGSCYTVESNQLKSNSLKVWPLTLVSKQPISFSLRIKRPNSRIGELTLEAICWSNLTHPELATCDYLTYKSANVPSFAKHPCPLLAHGTMHVVPFLGPTCTMCIWYGRILIHNSTHNHATMRVGSHTICDVIYPKSFNSALHIG